MGALGLGRLGLVAVLGLVSVGTVAGCGGADDGYRHCNDGDSGNSLKGSYCEDIDMAYSQVRVLTVSNALRIEYVRPLGTGSEKTLQIIIDGSSVVLEPNVEIGMVASGAQVRRIVAEAPQNLTAELEARSSITFTDYSDMTIGKHIAGKFAMLFKSGRTLNGEFEATIEDALPSAM